MAGGGGSGEERKLDQTPTWAVASVCAVIIIISILLEKVLEKVGKVVFLLLVFMVHFCVCVCVFFSFCELFLFGSLTKKCIFLKRRFLANLLFGFFL